MTCHCGKLSDVHQLTDDPDDDDDDVDDDDICQVADVDRCWHGYDAAVMTTKCCRC